MAANAPATLIAASSDPEKKKGSISVIIDLDDGSSLRQRLRGLVRLLYGLRSGIENSIRLFSHI